MKFTISKDQFSNGLQAVQNVVSTRTTLPILSNVRVEAADNRLQLTATDLDVTISCSVEAQVQTPGATTIPVKRLFSIIRELGVNDLDIEVNDKDVCHLRAGASFYKINGLPAEEYPPNPEFKDSNRFSVAQDKLRNMFRKTSFAISTDETRYVLNGIFMSLKDDKVTMVATDGRRLALVEEELNAEVTGDLIIPTKAVNELNRLLGSEGEVAIQYSDNQAAFGLKQDGGLDIHLITKLVEGNYPNYRQVIPGEVKEKVQLDREEFLHALRRAEIMTSDKANSVRLVFSKNNLTISANTPDIGEGEEKLAIKYTGAEFAIAFNPVFVMDPLKALEEDEVYIEFSDELSPALLKVTSPFLYVLMPMRMS